MEEVGVIAGGAALLFNGLIHSLGTSHRIENLAEARRAQEIDASGCVVVPGFVDPAVKMLQMSPQAIHRLIAHGTTAVRFVGDVPRRVVRQFTAAGVDVGCGGAEPAARVLTPVLPAAPDDQVQWAQALNDSLPVALSTGGAESAPAASMTAAMALACLAYRFTPEQALCAATLNAAHAIGLGATHGSLEFGKQADLLVLDVADYREIPYQFGVNLVRMVIKRGHVVYRRGEIRWPKL